MFTLGGKTCTHLFLLLASSTPHSTLFSEKPAQAVSCEHTYSSGGVTCQGGSVVALPRAVVALVGTRIVLAVTGHRLSGSEVVGKISAGEKGPSGWGGTVAGGRSGGGGPPWPACPAVPISPAGPAGPWSPLSPGLKAGPGNPGLPAVPEKPVPPGYPGGPWVRGVDVVPGKEGPCCPWLPSRWPVAAEPGGTGCWSPASVPWPGPCMFGGNWAPSVCTRCIVVVLGVGVVVVVVVECCLWELREVVGLEEVVKLLGELKYNTFHMQGYHYRMVKHD